MELLLEPLSSEQENEILRGIEYSRIELRRDLASLKYWISQQSHLPPSASSEPDAFYSNFLVGCKGDVSRAKVKIDNYYRFRSRATELCAQRDPLDPKLVDLKPHFQLLTLPKATPDGSRVTMTLSVTPDYPGYDVALIVKRMLLIIEMRLRTEMIHGGEYVVMDNKNYSASYFFSLRPNFIRNFIHFIQNVLPWRIKGIFSLNTPMFLHVALNRVIKPLIKRKIAKRWHVYSEGYEILIEHFSPDILPREFGGRGESVQVLSGMDEFEIHVSRIMYLPEGIFNTSLALDRWIEHAGTARWRDWFLKDGSETTGEDVAESRGALIIKNFWNPSAL